MLPLGLRSLILALLLIPGPVAAAPALTHGPMLGNVTSESVRVWARTGQPSDFFVRYSEDPDLANSKLSGAAVTSPQHDNAAWIELRGLRPDTKYFYAVKVDGSLADTRIEGRFNSFRTLPDPETHRHPDLNPAGLFNFRFEVGSCNHQVSPSVAERRFGRAQDAPYSTMLSQLKDKVHFNIINGDWIYETGREVTAEQWAQANAVSEVPEIVRSARGITGVWENYKLYLERGANMANFHREIPMFATFDDHEIYNDIIGAGEIGLRADSRNPALRSYDSGATPTRREWSSREREVERSVFRDPALQAWSDYVGWANPDATVRRPIHFGRARFEASSDLLHDPAADFSGLNPGASAPLHVHWGQGNSGVYEVLQVLDRNTLRIRPAPEVSETARYSIGTNFYTKFRVSNAEFYLLDTRSFRSLHNPLDPHDPGTTVLGRQQLRWLVAEMQQSDAAFFFVVSSVSFMIPHDNRAWRTGGDKDESWTAYAAERDRLLDFFEALDRPVFLLTGDIHNSASVRVSPKVWEFLSGPHTSPNHYISEMGNVPLTGPYLSQGRPVTMKWATGLLDDSLKANNPFPHYCVVQVNNAFNSPDAEGNPRWIAYRVPQVIFKFYCGLTGDLKYAESVSAH